MLDEADRILDLGFEKAVNAIIENLPRQRQTLLFSATQTKSVKDLARLSLKVRVFHILLIACYFRFVVTRGFGTTAVLCFVVVAGMCTATSPLAACRLSRR